MDSEPNKAREYLDQRRTTLLAQLQQLLPEVTHEFIEVDAAIRAMDEASAKIRARGDWSRYRKAIDAIEAYLDRVQEPVSPHDVAHALKVGGFALDAKRPLYNVIDSIRYHLKGDKSRLLVLSDGRIYPRKWPPEKIAGSKP